LDVGVRDVAVLEVARVGRVWETGELLRPFVLLDENGAEIAAVSEFLHHMLADDARPSSLRLVVRLRTAGLVPFPEGDRGCLGRRGQG